MSNVFAFRTIRGPQRYTNGGGVPLYRRRAEIATHRRQPTPTVLDRLATAGRYALRVAEQFVSSPAFVGVDTALPAPLRELDRWLTHRRNRALPADVVASLPSPPRRAGRVATVAHRTRGSGR